MGDELDALLALEEELLGVDGDSEPQGGEAGRKRSLADLHSRADAAASLAAQQQQGTRGRGVWGEGPMVALRAP